MRRKLIMNLLAVKIEWHWWHIMRDRRCGNRLIDRGEPLTSKRLIRLSKRITRHGISALAFTQKYENLMAQELPPHA